MFRIADADIAEALIWQIWQDYVPRSKRLKLTDGRTVRVYHPGIMNTDSGPDFLGAELSYGPGTRLKGDVEIHIRPSDWRRHGHEKDPRYDTVVLHVVMWNEENLSSIRKQNRQYIPTLVLSEYLQESLNRIKTDTTINSDLVKKWTIHADRFSMGPIYKKYRIGYMRPVMLDLKQNQKAFLAV